MITKFIRKISLIVCLTTLILSQTVADESSFQQGTYKLARLNFLRALVVMGETFKSCAQKQEIIDLPHRKNLVQAESRYCLVYPIFFKQDHECTAQAAKELLMSSKIIEIGSPFNWEKEPVKNYVTIVLESRWKELEAKAKYRIQVSPTDQTKIESIPGPQKPFNLLKSWDQPF
jgi:hypothetical protein